MVTKEMAKHIPTVHECPEMNILKDYVQAGDETRFDGMAQGGLRLDVTHSNLVQRWHDIVFHDTMSILAVKEKLYRHGGTPCSMQELYLRRAPGDTVFLMDDNKSLAYYGARCGMEMHIKDLDPHSISLHGGLEDVSQVEKYVMADEEYDNMKNTVRAINREKAAKAAAELARKREAGEDVGEELGGGGYGGGAPAVVELTIEEVQAAYAVGARCECDPGGRRGTVMHAGPIINAKGMFIGVKLDEPQGNNNGTKDGKKYFDCPGDKYGVFAKPANVRVGDYPELDPFASDDEF